METATKIKPNMKKYYAYVDNSIEMEISEECVLQCAHSGQCDEDVKRWLEMDEIKTQFKRLTCKTMRSHIKEWGAHEESELNRMDKHTLSLFILWDLCFSILDEINN